MKRSLPILLLAAVFAGCAGDVSVVGRADSFPPVFPDYIDVTVPKNIAPLNFRLSDSLDCTKAVTRFRCGGKTVTVTGTELDIPVKKWRALTELCEDITVEVTVCREKTWTAFRPFQIHVSPDRIDSHLAYRLIDPGYETWNKMGIYQRCVENFAESPVITNDRTDGNCMNCHSFCGRDPGKMLFHMRAKNGGTYVWNDGKLEKLNTKTPETLSACVYPFWHPSGRFVAFSVNDIAQAFHSTDRNRIEVYDSASDVVVYDVGDHRLTSSPLLMQSDVLETFPAFSPDGGRLYFCTSPRREVPFGYRDIRYSICSIAFDPGTFSFGGQVDTVYHASKTGLCAVFPRVSPDGRFLLITETAYGCFPIWHRDADLRLVNLETGEISQLSELNSPDVDSYHAWSGNGRWIVFSSRRIDGLYTRLFLCHVDKEGQVAKPFVLPQKDTRLYDDLLKSYNIPEFIEEKVTVDAREIAGLAKNGKGTEVFFRE